MKTAPLRLGTWFRSAIAGAFGFLVFAEGDLSSASACATAPPRGEMARVVDEEALVAFDEVTHTEHFVRRASFRSTGKGFGFLVPTPGKPDLGEADDSIFSMLAERLEAPVSEDVHGYDLTIGSLFFRMSKSASDARARAPVRVLDVERVAGLDATVLEADDADALALWLTDHDYASSPSLSEWLEPYVAKKWKITAFKVASDQAETGARNVGLKSVRMSFHTDTPFFPYREPSDQRGPLPANLNGASVPGRSLRVYMLSSRRMDATLGESAPWNAKLLLAERSPENLVESLGLPGFDRSRRWLTVFEDTQDPRPGTDEVFFASAHDDTPVPIPAVHVTRPRQIEIPVELVALLLAGAGYGAWRFRRAKKPQSTM